MKICYSVERGTIIEYIETEFGLFLAKHTLLSGADPGSWWWGVGEHIVQWHTDAGVVEGYSCGVPFNGGHRSVKMCLEEQLTGDLLDHELAV